MNTVTVPLVLTADMLRAVRLSPLTCTEDLDEAHRRIGWLLCAWDVLVEHRVASAKTGLRDDVGPRCNAEIGLMAGEDDDGEV